MSLDYVAYLLAEDPLKKEMSLDYCCIPSLAEYPLKKEMSLDYCCLHTFSCRGSFEEGNESLVYCLVCFFGRNKGQI